jgi:hypothetical protein
MALLFLARGLVVQALEKIFNKAEDRDAARKHQIEDALNA